MASQATVKRLPEKPESAAAGSEAAGPGDAPLFDPVRDLGKRGALIIGALVLLANIPLIHHFFRNVLGEAAVTATIPYQDNFERADLGPNYWDSGIDWRIENGELHAPGVKNNPLWLQAKLPDDVAVDFDVRSPDDQAAPAAGSNMGGLKFELFGDGINHQSGYIFIFGGWGNQVTTIAKLDEHGVAFNAQGMGLQGPPQDTNQNAVAGRRLDELFENHTFGPSDGWRIQRTDVRVQPGVPYHMHVERKNGELRWSINGNLVLQVRDAFPLKGKHHDRFAFSGWESDVYFDNLSIQPL